MTRRERADVAVIGAGFGGLAAALRLSELGAKVVGESLFPGQSMLAAALSGLELAESLAA